MERGWLFPGGPVLAEGGLHQVKRDEGHLQLPVSRHTSTIVHQHTSSPTTPKPEYLAPTRRATPHRSGDHTHRRPRTTRSTTVPPPEEGHPLVVAGEAEVDAAVRGVEPAA